MTSGSLMLNPSSSSIWRWPASRLAIGSYAWRAFASCALLVALGRVFTPGGAGRRSWPIRRRYSGGTLKLGVMRGELTLPRAARSPADEFGAGRTGRTGRNSR